MDAGDDGDIVQQVDTVEPRAGGYDDRIQLELGGTTTQSAFASRVKIPPLKLAGKNNFFVHNKRPGKGKAQSKNRNRYEQ